MKSPIKYYGGKSYMTDIIIDHFPKEYEVYVWLSATGSKYHNKPDCGRMNPNKAYQVTLSEAESQGYGPCSKCFH